MQLTLYIARTVVTPQKMFVAKLFVNQNFSFCQNTTHFTTGKHYKTRRNPPVLEATCAVQTDAAPRRLESVVTRRRRHCAGRKVVL